MDRRNPVDVHVGSRLRLRRTMAGMSQERLADAVGLTFQQIQKYEKGANRIGASRMFQFSRILDVPPSFFFDGMSAATGDGGMPGLSEPPAEAYAFDRDPLTSRESLELMRAYNSIRDPQVRKRVFELIKSIADRAGDHS